MATSATPRAASIAGQRGFFSVVAPVVMREIR